MTYVHKLRKHRGNIGMALGASVWNNPSPRDVDEPGEPDTDDAPGQADADAAPAGAPGV